MDAADLFADLPDEPSDRRGVVERVVTGFKGGFGSEPLGLSPENRARFPALAPFNPLLAGGDAALRSIPAVTGGVAGALAGLSEIPVTGYPAANRTEADRLQRDLTILGTGALIEPGMGAAAMRAPSRAPRAAPEAPVEQPAAPPVRSVEVPVPAPAAPVDLPSFLPPKPVEPPPVEAPVVRAPEGPIELPSFLPPEPAELFADLPVVEAPIEAPARPAAAPMEPPPMDPVLARVMAARVAREAPPAPAAPAAPKEDWFARATAAREARLAEEAAKEAAKPPPKEPVIDFGKAPVERRKPVSLARYIADTGGIELTPEARDMGLDKWKPPGAKKPVARKGGKSIDGFWRDHLAEGEANYLQRDPDGFMSRDIRDELYEALGREQAGFPRYRLDEVERAKPQMPGERALEVERSADIIRQAAEAAGEGTIEAGPLYDAAQMLLRGEETDALRALTRARQPARDIEAALAAERAALDARIGIEDIPFKRGGLVGR